MACRQLYVIIVKWLARWKWTFCNRKTLQWRAWLNSQQLLSHKGILKCLNFEMLCIKNKRPKLNTPADSIRNLLPQCFHVTFSKLFPRINFSIKMPCSYFWSIYLTTMTWKHRDFMLLYFRQFSSLNVFQIFLKRN